MIKDNLKQIHDASMYILENIGMEFQDQEILEILSKKGIKVENGRAFFTEQQIIDNVKYAPEEFVIYSRNEKYNMRINTESIHYTPGYGCAKIREANGEIRDGKLKDLIKFTELVHSSDVFDINGGIVIQPNDIEADLSHLIMLYTTLVKSDKCIMTVPGTHKHFKESIDLVSIAVGGYDKLKEKPQMITLVSTLSPLKVDINALETIKLSCEFKQPMVICPGPMAGATGPISLAGNIAMGNAEAIATIALTQILRPGTPVIYGLACTTTDMKTGNVSLGSPGFPVQAAYGARLAKMYNLPNRTAGTQCDANGITMQAGYESMLTMNTAHQEKSNFIMHSAGILDSYSSMSFEKFVADLEIISMLKYYHKDLEINDKTLALDIIKEVADGGTFLTHKHTAKRCRKDPWMPTISLRGKLKLSDTPDNLMLASINEAMDKLLNNYKKPEMDETIESKLREYIKTAGVENSVIELIDGVKELANV
ncbi:MAG: trimethylamine methyltransferase family protein [Peptostreptococcaceae bacterium]